MPEWRTLLLVTGTAFSIFFFNEARYADSGTMEQVAIRLDQKITEDQLTAIQARIWALEDRHKGVEMPTSVFEEYRGLLEKKKKYIEKLGKIKL